MKHSAVAEQTEIKCFTPCGDGKSKCWWHNWQSNENIENQIEGPLMCASVS